MHFIVEGIIVEKKESAGKIVHNRYNIYIKKIKIFMLIDGLFYENTNNEQCVI